MKKLIAIICTLALVLSTAVVASADLEVRQEMAASYGGATYISDASALQEYCNKTGLHSFEYGYVVTYQGGFGGGGADASIPVDDTQGASKLVFDARVIGDDFCSIEQLNYAMYPDAEFAAWELTYPAESTGSVSVSPHWDDEYLPDVVYPWVSLTDRWQHYEMDISGFNRFRLYIDALGATPGANELCAVVVANVKLVSDSGSAQPIGGTDAGNDHYVATQPSEWAAPEVAKAMEYGIISESNPIVINYQSSITREEFAQLIVNCVTSLKGSTAEDEYKEAISSGKHITFEDSSLLHVMVAASMGIVKGVGDGKFAPENNITRQEIAVMMYRAIEYMEAIKGRYLVDRSSDLTKFADASNVADWAAESVATLSSNSIMNGTSETTLSPLDSTTGEQAIALVARVYELVKK